MFNVFKPKPKEQLYTPANQSKIQGSGTGSNYANNASNYKSVLPAKNSSSQNMSVAPKAQQSSINYTPVRQTQKPATQQSSRYAFNGNRVTPQSGMGSKAAINASQTPQRRADIGKRVLDNSGQNRPQIQGSGMGSNYASNPSNYQAPQSSAPQLQQQVQQPQQNDPNRDWMDYVTNANSKQKESAISDRQDIMSFLQQKGQLANDQLRSSIPTAQNAFNELKGNTEATIEDLIRGGQMQKESAEDYYGDAQRQSAKALRDTQAQQQRTFAGLGTLEGTGEGSFAEANTNVMSDFNRVTQQNLKAKADKLTEIDMNVKSAERNARQVIVQEEAKMNDMVKQIQFAIANNDLETAQGIKNAYSESQQYINQIEDSLAQTKYQFALQQQELENEMANAPQFSEEFRAGGAPTTQAEYEYYIKNKDAIDSMNGITGGDAENQTALNVVDQMKQIYFNPDNPISIGDSSVGATGLLNRAGQAYKGATNQDYRDQVDRYNNLRGFAVGILNKARQAGTLNEGEYQTMIQNIPNERTTSAVAQNWFKDINQFLGSNNISGVNNQLDPSQFEV